MLVSFLLLIQSYWDVKFDYLRENPEGESLATEFSQLWTSKAEVLSAEDMENLRAHKILVVPGFLSNVTSEIRKNFGWMVPEMRKDFDDQFKWLQENGIAAEKVKIESEGSMEDNAPSIHKSIHDSPKPVILLSHSKGGLDILNALFVREDLQPKVSGWIAVQSPFWGTPVADIWTKSSRAKKIAHEILSRLGGSSRSLLSLRVEERLPYMNEHNDQILELMRRIPTISFASWKRDEPGDWDTPFEPYFRDQLSRAEIKSDGVIPLKSMLLPGAPFVAIEGVDHVTTIGAIQLRPFDRVRFIQVMLKLLLQHKVLSTSH